MHHTNSTPEDKTSANRNWKERRRDFLRTLGLGAGGFALSSLYGCGGDQESGRYIAENLINEEHFWRRTNQLFTQTNGIASMNIDIGATKPISTHNILLPQAKKTFDTPSFTDLANQRREIGQALGVDEITLALTRGASASTYFSLLSIKWNMGDVIVTSNHEHPATLSALNTLTHLFGVKVEVVKLPTSHLTSDGEIIHSFKSKIDSLASKNIMPKALLWSSPSYRSGIMLPLNAMIKIAKDHNLITICDGAHLLGMKSINYGATDIDFLCASGHKWQCATQSTGILIFSKRVLNSEFDLSNFTPWLVRDYTDKKSVSQDPSLIAMRLSVCGSTRIPYYDAMLNSCRVWNEIGIEKIESYIKSLNKYTKTSIIERWGGNSLYSPLNSEPLTSGICAFNPFFDANDIYSKEKSDRFVHHIFSKYGIDARNVELPIGNSSTSAWPIRLCTPVWLSPKDIDNALDAIWKTAQQKNL